jgi:hypothetical protein
MTATETATFTRTAAALVAENDEPPVDVERLAVLVSGVSEKVEG